MNHGMTTQLVRAAPLLLLGIGTACARLDTKSEVDVKPIRVEPIHITVDVNVRIDRELDQFFAFEEELEPAKPATAPVTQPATAPAATTSAAADTTGKSL
jgi:hypothetical protein